MSNSEREWTIVEHPGYLGSSRAKKIEEWNKQYGEGSWRLEHWQTADGKLLTFKEVFQIYLEGYEKYFKTHPDEAAYLISNFSYGYDEDLITKEEAFDPHLLYNRPGFANQFHHVAFNIALINIARKDFQGSNPIQVREGKAGTPEEKQPNGWKWSPGRIPCATPEIIPQVSLKQSWWQPGTVEDFYQRAKVLEVRSL